MTTLELLERMPNGEVVTDKRVLRTLKRNGLIFDYSPWGYLESQNIYYKDKYYGGTNHQFTYYGPEIKADDKGSCQNPYESFDDYLENCTIESNPIEYKGFTFETKYLSGCFNAYLVKKSGPSTTGKTVSRTMSVFGVVV